MRPWNLASVVLMACLALPAVAGVELPRDFGKCEFAIVKPLGLQEDMKGYLLVEDWRFNHGPLRAVVYLESNGIPGLQRAPVLLLHPLVQSYDECGSGPPPWDAGIFSS